MRDSGKRKISWQETGFDCYQGSGIHQNLVTRCGIFSPSVGNSRNHDDSNTCSIAANPIQQSERTVVSPLIWANYILSDLVDDCLSVTDERAGQKTHCFNQMPGKCIWCKAYLVLVKENFPSSLTKKHLNAGYLETFNGFGVVLSYRAIAEYVGERKACSRCSDSGDGAKKSEQKKSVGGRERGGRNPLLSHFLFPLFFSFALAPCTLQCENT